MAKVSPFRAVLPAEDCAGVAALPYDVMSSEEARAMVAGRPHSFLRIDRAEVNLPPGTDPHEAAVYAKARELYLSWLSSGVYALEAGEAFFLYRLVMEGRAQHGIVACVSADEYAAGDIRKHELTRVEKEEDRVRHIQALDAQTGPIFLAHRPIAALKEISAVYAAKAPLFDFTAEDGVRHSVWRIDDGADIARVSALFSAVPRLYIADGHHRAASASRVCERKRAAGRAHGEHERILAVLFPADELKIMDYNRVVADLNGLTEEAFLAKIAGKFAVRKVDRAGFKPPAPHLFGCYVGGGFYELAAKEGSFDPADPIKALDVSILQDNLLGPVLGIGDPRKDDRIDFVGGIRGMDELVRRVDGGEAVAFALYPVSLDELMRVADADLIMPPKSTWFEPKLRSGIFIHPLG